MTSPPPSPPPSPLSPDEPMAGGPVAGGPVIAGPALRAITSARIFAPGHVAAYSTGDQLRLRADHAAARDAVTADLSGDLAELPSVRTRALDRRSYLARPDLGCRLDPESRDRVRELCASPADLQILIGDGLSATAVRVNAPPVEKALRALAVDAGFRVGPTLLIRQCRVGVLNEIGPLVTAPMLVLLIGERPGLATAESLSAYLAWNPRPGHTNADRNLISNIHAEGISPADAAVRVAGLWHQMREANRGGYTIRELRHPALTEQPAPRPRRT